MGNLSQNLSKLPLCSLIPAALESFSTFTPGYLRNVGELGRGVRLGRRWGRAGGGLWRWQVGACATPGCEVATSRQPDICSEKEPEVRSGLGIQGMKFSEYT